MGNKTVAIKVYQPTEVHPVFERLPVESIGGQAYRLLVSPGMVEGLAAGDEFEIAPEEPLGFRVLRRAGNVSVWFLFQQANQNRGADSAIVRESAERIGAQLDGGTEISLVFTVALSVGLPIIEAAFEHARAAVPGSAWMYSNLYDPVTREPLGWWSN